MFVLHYKYASMECLLHQYLEQVLTNHLHLFRLPTVYSTVQSFILLWRVCVTTWLCALEESVWPPGCVPLAVCHCWVFSIVSNFYLSSSVHYKSYILKGTGPRYEEQSIERGLYRCPSTERWSLIYGACSIYATSIIYGIASTLVFNGALIIYESSFTFTNERSCSMMK
jgi:hypothetical protein